ncbi:hypothetical protein [Hyphomonas sp.]|uniref:hypothetical protein n=1 Tax=Hyphomonas sp. TaxID=87 RepID=UPI0032987D5C
MRMTEILDITEALRQSSVLFLLFINGLFAAALEAILVRFSKDKAIVKFCFYPKNAGAVGTEKQDPSACVQRAVMRML